LVDVPAGGGYLRDHLPPGVEAIAVEESEAFAQRCRARGIDAVVCSLQAEDEPAEVADVVVSVAGTHPTPGKAGLLRAWRRLLRPGGRLVVADVVTGSAEARFLDGFVGHHNGQGHDGWFLGDDLLDVALGVGFTHGRVADGSYHWWA